MSDTDTAYDSFSPSFLEDSQRRQAASSIVQSADVDPEKAARAIELGDATGADPVLIHADLDHFEQQQKIAANSKLVGDNYFLQAYLNSHPLAASVSHDDLGQLDAASQAIGELHGKSFVDEAHDWLKSNTIQQGIATGFGDQPLGKMFVGEGFKPTGNPLLDSMQNIAQATYQAATSIPELGLRTLNAAIYGTAYGAFGPESGERLAQVMMDPGLQATMMAAGPPGMMAEGVLAALRSASPWLRAGKGIPTGVHPELDKVAIEQSKQDVAKLSDAVAESVKSATRERSADMYEGFARQHVGDEEIGISADKVRELYGDSGVTADNHVQITALEKQLETLRSFNKRVSDINQKKSYTGYDDPEFIKDQSDRAAQIKETNDIVDKIHDLKQTQSKPSGIHSKDGILGWIPDLEEQLSAAEATGGDIKVSTAKLLANIDPDIFKELKDDIRVRPDGITAEEGKALEPKEAITEPLPLTRGSAALEPMFSVGDRKLELKKRAHDEKMDIGSGVVMDEKELIPDHYNLHDEKGEPIGFADIIPLEGGKKVFVANIGALEDKGYAANSFGPALTRDIAKQLKQLYPESEQIGGYRISGAREKAGTERLVWAKFEDLNNPAKWQGFHDSWKEIQPGVRSEPIEMTPEKQKVVDSVNEVLDRIVPKGVGTEGFEKIVGQGGKARVGGVYTRYADSLPWISWSLESGDSLATVRHEAVHHLKDAGFFKQGEWDTLSRAARDQGWMDKYDIEHRYSKFGLNHSEMLEESIADAYKDWAKKPETETPLGRIFSRIKEILDGIRVKLKEAFGGELTPEEIFQKIESGEVGSREGTSMLRGVTREDGNFTSQAPNSKFQEGDIPDIGGREAENLRAKITKLTGELSVLKGQGFDIAADPRSAELKEARTQLRSITSGTFGMTGDQYARYMKLIEKRNSEDLAAASKSALEYQRKTQTKEWKANRVEMRDEVREEIEQRPDVALDQMMANEKVKFHPDSLSDQQKAGLPKEYMQKKDGIAPDDIAGYLGYHSGDTLVDRLSMLTADRKAAGMNAREWANHLIDSETDRRMEQRYGNLDQNILEEAKDQAISATQLDLLHEEVLHLGLRAGSEFPISKADLRQWNKESFDQTPIGSISTDAFLRVAGKAGRAAEMALLKEDFAEAFREKQFQNNAMIRANFAKQYEKARKSFDRTAKTFQKREVPSVPQEWTNWIHDILQRTGNRVNRSVQDLNEAIGGQHLQEFIDEKEAETMGNRPLPIADFLRDEDFRSEMNKLTAQQFTDLKSAIDMLAKQGRDEKKIYAAGEAADRAQVVSEMREKLKTFPQQLLPDERNWLQEKMQDPKEFFAGMTAIPTLMRRWERADPRGIFSRYITYPMRVADNTESVLQREVSKQLREVGEIKDPDKLVDSPFADPKTRTEENPNGTRWNGFSRKHVLGMLAHAGNDSNWRVLAKGYSADPDALMQWLVKNTTKEDWAQAQKRGDLVFKPLIAKADTVYENVSGATVEKIPLNPISNDHGDFAGWYHPLVADPLRKEVWVKDADTGQWQRNSTGKRDSVMDKYGKAYATTANGYTRKRTGATYPLDLDITTMNSTLNQMVHDISYRAPLLEVQKIIQNRAFQNEVDNHYGAHYKDLLEPWLQDMAGQASTPDATQKWVGEWSEYLRQNVISTYIGGNIYTALKHGPTALILSSRTVGARVFLPEFGKQLIERLAGDPLRKALEVVGADRYAEAVKGMYAQSPELGLTMSEYAMKHSEELQRRERHWQDTIRGETKVQVGDPTLREKVIEKGSWLVAQSDMLSAKPTWIAEYNKRTTEGLSHGEARDLADDAVLRAHGSTGRSNQPSLVRGGGPVHGWLTSVYGFMGARMQRMIEVGHQLNDIHELGKEGELKAAAARIPKLLTDAMTFAIWPILVEEAVQGIGTDDHRTWGTAAIHALTLGMSSSVLYIRDLVHGLTDNHEPGVGLLSSAAHDVTKPFRDLGAGKTAFDKAHAGKTVGDILTMLGEVKGVSPKVIGNASRFGIDLVNKQQHPKTAGDYFRGITRGTMKKREEK